MGCCGRKIRRQASGPPLCKTLEDGGAQCTVWPVVTADKIHLTIRISIGRQIQQIDLFSIIEKSSCVGPTARWLRGELPMVKAATTKSPYLFSGYTKTGISIGKLCQLCRKTKSYGHQIQTHPHP